MSISQPDADAEVIELCRQMLAVCQEEDEIVRRAGAAGEFESKFPKVLKAAFASLAFAITRAAPPTTPEGVRALALVANLFSDRDNKERLRAPYTIGDWFKTAALLAAAGMRESIPLPSTLPEHWPAV